MIAFSYDMKLDSQEMVSLASHDWNHGETASLASVAKKNQPTGRPAVSPCLQTLCWEMYVFFYVSISLLFVYICIFQIRVAHLLSDNGLVEQAHGRI